MPGPLEGVRVLELAGIGPGPFACMLLADLGADVLRVDRPGPGGGPDVLLRGRRSVAVDLKADGAADVVLRLAESADVLVEGFRPGVAERLGVGPQACTGRNPGLVYARMTGWGQQGPLAARVGHDINYLALTGALHAVGEAGGPPVPPLNLVADFGGGSLYLVMGVLAALVERAASGLGQVVDVAMVDGVSSLLAMTHTLRAAGQWQLTRGSNLLDGGAPFYATYACSDGRHVAVGALEPAFFAAMVAELGLTDLPAQDDQAHWPELRARLAAAFAAEPRDTWAARFAGLDACVTPVLDLDEAAAHPHLVARGTVGERHGVVQPAAAPRLSRTPGRPGSPGPAPGADTVAALQEWGFARDEVDGLLAAGVIRQA